MSQLKDLMAQIESLQKQARQVRINEAAEAINQVHQLVAEYQLTPEDVFPNNKRRTGVKRSGKVAAKYRDPATGDSWSGRGMTPKWLLGKNREDYLIQE